MNNITTKKLLKKYNLFVGRKVNVLANSLPLDLTHVRIVAIVEGQIVFKPQRAAYSVFSIRDFIDCYCK
jgi:hypothetical protein